LDRERAGLYPGGRKHKFERYAWFGCLIIFWVKRGIRAGFHREAARLACSGCLMIIAAVLRCGTTRFGNRRPVKSCQLETKATPV